MGEGVEPKLAAVTTLYKSNCRQIAEQLHNIANNAAELRGCIVITLDDAGNVIPYALGDLSEAESVALASKGWFQIMGMRTPLPPPLSTALK